MTQPNASEPSNSKEVKLPRRDWILLPALSFATICLLVFSTDVIARRMFASLPGSGEDCIVFNDPSTGARGIPNSVCREKIPEGEVTEYRFNSCGHRTDLQCGTKPPPGTYRIVMIGGSYAMGMRVPNEKTIAALLPSELSRRTGRNVELYNEGMPWRPPHIVALHFNEVLTAKPDMILWLLHPSDIWNPLLPLPDPGASQVPQAFSALSPYRKARRILGRLKLELSSHSVFMFRHFLYESQNQLISSYLAERPDAPFGQKIHGPEFLRTKPNAEWQSHLRDLDSDVADIEAQAKAAGVPVVAALLPQRAQVARISKGVWPAGFDPYKLDNELRSMIESHGGIYVDILPYFRSIPNTEQGFFPLDVHPNARGHAMISGLLARELTNGAVPVLKVAAQQRAVLEEGR
jgi:hypothetical protein